MYIMEREILLDWLRLIQSGGSIAGLLYRNSISEIVIYGAGDIGLKFYEDIKKTKINVRCFIDQSDIYIDENTCVYSPNNIADMSLDNCAVIVCSIVHYPEIYDFLRSKISDDTKIYSIEDIIYDELTYLRYNAGKQ